MVRGMVESKVDHVLAVIDGIEDMDLTVRQDGAQAFFKVKLVVAAKTIDKAVRFVSQPMGIADPLVSVPHATNRVFQATRKIRIPILLVPTVGRSHFLGRIGPCVVGSVLCDGLGVSPMYVVNVGEESKTLLVGQPEFWLYCYR